MRWVVLFRTDVVTDRTDLCGVDIPDLHLGARASSPGGVSSRAESPTSMVASGPSSRRASLSSVGRASSGRSASSTSSRSTSFNLPNEARGEIRSMKAEPGDEIETEELDEEGGLGCLRISCLG